MIVRSWMVSILLLGWNSYSQSSPPTQEEAEYYLGAYANHYGIPLDFARAVVEQESGWHVCAISKKGAAGIMQLMPQTAARLGVRNRCNLEQNISGGIRYLAWLMNKFHGELRLVAAAYYAGERVVEARGLAYANRDVVLYVASIRQRVEQQRRFGSAQSHGALRRAK
jgi:soluble lytic murein transglycosylase-like protein